jgi:hypothetical protein
LISFVSSTMRLTRATISFLENVLRRTAATLALVGVISVFLLTGLMGLDFGFHWDEPRSLLAISRPLTNGAMLPGAYVYPSMIFDIGTIALAPESIPFYLRYAERPKSYAALYAPFAPAKETADIVAFVQSKTFLLRLRTVFLAITALSGLWLYGAVRAAGRSPWEGTLAAVVLLSSWEVAYHARWVAPDMLVMQFTALYLLFLVVALRSPSRPLFWLRFCAAVAGLASGSKYPGGILLLPTLCCAAWAMKQRNSAQSAIAYAKELILLVVIFAVVFLLSSPGVVLQPVTFLKSLRLASYIYATGHGAHTVTIFQHAFLLLTYLALVFTSHFWPIALIFFTCALLGAATMWKTAGWETGILLCGPVAFIVFMVSWHTMIVRNYMLLAPFLAFFSARGIFALYQTLAHRSAAQLTLTALITLMLLGNMAWLFHAADTIRHRQEIDLTGEVIAYIQRHSRTRYFLSPQLAHAVTMRTGSQAEENISSNPTDADRYLFSSKEVPLLQIGHLLCNRPWQYRVVSGPLEVNFDYYPDWLGDARAVDLSMRHARNAQMLSKP